MCEAKVADAIIAAISVAMNQWSRWPNTINREPGQPVPSVGHTKVNDPSVAMGIDCPSYRTPAGRWARVDAPAEEAGRRVVI
jgi:hypothetical protein